jgi:hypothetical protein
MAVTTDFTWFSSAPQFMENLFTAGPQIAPAVAANSVRDEYFGVWTDNPGSQIEGRSFFEDSGSPFAPVDEITLNSTNNAGLQVEPAVAGLVGNRYAVVYTDFNADPAGDVRAEVLTEFGGVVVADFLVDPSNAFADSGPAVGALADGGFVVSWTRLFAGNNIDIRAQVYNADGSPRGNHIDVDNLAQQRALSSSVAGLAGGNFVVAYEDQTTAAVYFRRVTAAGVVADANPVLIDNFGTNTDIHVVALADGGFAVAYTDSGWLISGTEITFEIFNADGSTRTNFIRANNVAFGGIEAGDQQSPTITTLGTGHIVVGWLDAASGNSYAQVFDAAGHAVGTNQMISSNLIAPEFAGLHGGFLANVDRSTVDDGAGNSFSIRTFIVELVRGFQGDSANDTIIGVNDGLREVMNGGPGDDTLIGAIGHDDFLGALGSDTVSYSTATAGAHASLSHPSLNTGFALGDTYNSIENLTGSGFDDILEGNAGNNTLNGGFGDDTVLFAHKFNDYTVEQFGRRIVVTGPDGTDTLIAIEHLKFDDITLTPTSDANPLFDRLFYLSRNADVFQASLNGLSAFGHFNAFGAHEGRDPDVFFSTSGYLAVNKDVAAAGANPLDHYHSTGWHQGRDPGPNFDTTLYLIHNPDVAAAGIDPLQHFLQNGFAEGRQAYQAIGSNIVGGFDAEYYLLHNPDVAAAGVDPLAHFNANGWHEGRNPNAYFDTAGYLSHYADVAAAGVNPLQHYVQSGYMEGRDPSASFDTLGYLAANPDVAAAHVNPLVHFLQFGIYEGRVAINDGVFH